MNYKTKYNKLKKQKIEIKPDYIESLSEPWFSLISLGLKKVEGRRNKGRFHDMKIGDIIQWTNDDFLPRTVLTIVKDKKYYNTFEEYLEKEGLENCLPGMPNMEYGLSVYFKYFTKEDEKEYGVAAIHIEPIKFTKKNLEKLTKNDLVNICKKSEISNYSGKNKSELINIIIDKNIQKN